MKRSLGTSLKKMGRDASNKYEKRLANERVRKIANDLSMEIGVVGKPPVKQKKLFIIEERRYVYPNTWDWNKYAEEGMKSPHWTKWIKYKAYTKRNARDNSLSTAIREGHKPQKYGYNSSLPENKEYQAVDLKK